MPRRYPGGRRRRPGRRPPDRRSARLRAHPPPAPRGFSAPGWRQFYGSFLPFGGRTKRLYFNKVSAVVVLSSGAGGAVAGFGVAGAFGALVGFALGVVAAGRWVERGGYYRA